MNAKKVYVPNVKNTLTYPKWKAITLIHGVKAEKQPQIIVKCCVNLATDENLLNKNRG
jgi:hypothetical protein